MATAIPPSLEKQEDMLKAVYEKEFERKKNIDDKANGMMTVASTVATLYGGFGLAVSSKLFNAPLQPNFQIITLFIGVSLLIACIFYAAKANLLKKYQYAVNFGSLIKEIKSNKNRDVIFNNIEINRIIGRPLDTTHLLLIKIYTRCTALNYEINECRADDLFTSQIIFFMGLVTIPIFVLSSITF